MFAETEPPKTDAFREFVRTLGTILPGVLLCSGIAVVAFGLQKAAIDTFGHAWIDAPVIALVAGAITRLFWAPATAFATGVSFSTHRILELAIVLLGASLSASSLIAVGPALLVGIAAIVTVSMFASYWLSLAFGLSKRSAVLVAAGNSICGNSAIIAVAPIVGAKKDEIACVVSFTALTGIIVVILLPLLAILPGMAASDYGILAGLTVYAVPQVLAATSPIGGLAIEIGTIVKLARVVMLGPVSIVLSLLAPRFRDPDDGDARRPPVKAMLPWFIVGFLVLATMRSVGLIPEFVAPTLSDISKALTVVAHAGLGLSIDAKQAFRSGPKVMLAAIVSVGVLVVLSLGLLALLSA